MSVIKRNIISTSITKLLLLLAVMGSSYSQAETAEYELTRQYGSVFFRVFHQQYLTLVGRFDQYSGTLQFDPEDLSATQLTATVDMGSLNMADGDVTETLVNSSTWFNIPVFPQATFTSSSAEVIDEHTVMLQGDLDFLGMIKPWSLQLVFHGGSDNSLDGSSIGISGSGTINRLDFGMDQYRNMAADEVDVEVNVKFNRR